MLSLFREHSVYSPTTFSLMEHFPSVARVNPKDTSEAEDNNLRLITTIAVETYETRALPLNPWFFSE